MENERNRTEGIKDETITNEDSVARNEGEELERRSRQSPRERSENKNTDSRNAGVCSFCKGNKSKVAYSSENGDQKLQCYSCGEALIASADSLGGSALFEEPVAAAAAVNEVDLNSLPNIPFALLADNTNERSLSSGSAVCCSNQDVHSLKTPRHGECNFAESVQVPGQTTSTTLFLMEQNHTVNRSEKLFYLCFVPSEEFAQVYERITEREHNTILRTLRDQLLTGFEFNHCHEITVLADDEVTVSFQLPNESQRNFRIRYPLAENFISLYDVQSRSQSRICPGARVHMCVECTGDPRELCQGTIRVTVVNTTGTRSMIFPIVAFGPSN